MLGAVLIVAVALVVIGATRPRERTFIGTLKELLPQAEDVPGWAVAYYPVAETAEMQNATAELLNYDNAIYAIYTRGEMRVSVYAAYWLPGKMSSRLIAGHTPDVCWVGRGWRPLTADGWTVGSRTVDGVTVGPSDGRTGAESASGQSDGGPLTVGRSDSRTEHPLQMEHRIFRLGEQTEHVVFCQIVGGRLLSYRTGGPPPWYGFLSDMWDRGFHLREEQFFLRISSNRPLAEFRDAEPVTILLARFRRVFNREARE
jgi:hypothetical protein